MSLTGHTRAAGAKFGLRVHLRGRAAEDAERLRALILERDAHGECQRTRWLVRGDDRDAGSRQGRFLQGQ